MHLAIFAILAVGLGLWYLSTRIMETTLAALGDPRSKIRERSHVPALEGVREPMRKMEDWARENGYEEDVMFDFWTMSEEQTLFCRTWLNRQLRTHLVFYFGMGKHLFELVTIYDDKTGVTTANSADGHTLPAAPGAFIQTFPDVNIIKLRELHEEGCRTLERRTGLAPRESTASTLELIIQSLIRQAKYVMSIKGWKWRGIWWLAFRKRQMIGKDVGWQLDQFGVYEPQAEGPGTLQ